MAVAYAMLGGHRVPSRPDLGAEIWEKVDRAIDDGRRASELRLLIVLVPEDAENSAAMMNWPREPGPDVIAIGYADRSISFTIDGDTVDENEDTLGAMLDAAGEALERGELAHALLYIACHLGSLRVPARKRGSVPPPSLRL